MSEFTLSGGSLPLWMSPNAETGKSDTGGGFVEVSSGKSAAEAGIVCLSIGVIGDAFCGGAIGTEGRTMCIRDRCDVKSHVRKIEPSAFNPMIKEVGVFIESSARAVYVEPSVPSEYF